MDHYVETIIPIKIEPGRLSFKVESALTAHVNQDFKYIKVVAEKKLEWDTVAVNFKQGVGNCFDNTHVFVSLGFGLKRCLKEKLITFNPRGKVST